MIVWSLCCVFSCMWDVEVEMRGNTLTTNSSSSRWAYRDVMMSYICCNGWAIAVRSPYIGNLQSLYQLTILRVESKNGVSFCLFFTLF